LAIKKEVSARGAGKGQKLLSGTRDAIIKDLQRVHKLFPDLKPDRDFYRNYSKFADSAWKAFFPRFKDFVRAADLTPKKDGRPAADAPPVVLDAEHQVKIDLEKENTKREGTKKKYTEALNRIQTLEEEREVLFGLKNHTPQILDIPPRLSHGTSESVAVGVFSDWHIEETVEKDDVSGMNEFNLVIGDARVTKAWQGFYRLYDILSRDTHIKDVIVALLGDFISNSIHEDLAETNGLLPTDAMYKAQNLIVSGLKFLLKNLPKDVKISVVCHSGNHGRMTVKQRGQSEAGNSLERFMYFNIRDFFRDEPRVSFQIANGYHTYTRLFEQDRPYVIRWHHGHAVKYQGGVGGIYVPVNKAINEWNKTIRDVDLDVFGHYHQYIDAGNFVCNGSIIGYNDFAVRNKFPYEPPRQAFFLINKKYRSKTMATPIFVSE
jgi:hypothetical protein